MINSITIELSLKYEKWHFAVKYKSDIVDIISTPIF